MDTNYSIPCLVREWLRRSALLLKVVGIGFLGGLLLIPLGLVWGTMQERLQRQTEAVASVTGPWGGAQRLLGPVLVVPFTWQAESEETVLVEGRPVVQKRLREQTGEACFLPEQLTVNGHLEPSERRRGIYTAHVYAANLTLTGRFAPPNWKFLEGLRDLTPQWQRARVGIAISDLRGAPGLLTLEWNGARVPLQPGAQLDGLANGIHAEVPLAAGQAVEFSLPLALNGSGSFRVAPLARQTQVTLDSSWPDPDFDGAYLPARHTVTAQGFSAEWQVSYYGRNFPQQWSSYGVGGLRPDATQLEATAFGLSMAEALNPYRMVERAIKYGVLFLALVFTAFFLFETCCGLALNGLNDLLVGAALCLFFLGLLALTEIIGFGAAYAVAAVTATVLIGAYSRSILGDGRRALAVTGLLGGVFGYLFLVLRMEDYALVAGTAALTAVLAAVMFATRRLRGDASVKSPREVSA